MDTHAVRDVIGLRARDDGATPTQVLPGRAKNSVQVLIPNDRSAPWGFHDVTLVDTAGAMRPPVSKEETVKPDFAPFHWDLCILWSEHCA